jgi:hypothetical protein
MQFLNSLSRLQVVEVDNNDGRIPFGDPVHVVGRCLCKCYLQRLFFARRKTEKEGDQKTDQNLIWNFFHE